MSYKTYTAPEYYKRFSCKCGKCRNTCCGGWGISLTMSEYYRLIGLDCSPELRLKLDCAFYRPENPSPERFALINRRFDGKCPLQRDDGLCGIQKECGEDVISSVCRYYPRSIKNTAPPECCCSSSCEAVIELLLNIKTPLRFESLSLNFEIPEDELSEEYTEEKIKYERLKNMHFDPELIKNLTGESTIIRKTSTAIIQNRKFSLSDRFSLLRSFLSQIDSVFICADDDTNKLKKEKSPSEISKGQSLKTICDMFAPEYSEAADNFAAVSNSQLPQNISQYLCDSAKLINLFSKYSQSQNVGRLSRIIEQLSQNVDKILSAFFGVSRNVEKIPNKPSGVPKS